MGAVQYDVRTVSCAAVWARTRYCADRRYHAWPHAWTLCASYISLRVLNNDGKGAGVVENVICPFKGGIKGPWLEQVGLHQGYDALWDSLLERCKQLQRSRRRDVADRSPNNEAPGQQLPAEL